MNAPSPSLPSPFRRASFVVLLLALVSLGMAPASLREQGPRQGRRVAVEDTTQARVIVKYRADATLMRIAAAGATAAGPQHAGVLSLRLGLPLRDGRTLGARTQGLRGDGVTSAELARRLAAEPDVEWAVVDQRRTIFAGPPNDPYYPDGQTTITPVVGQWYLRAPDATIVSAINAVGAWAVTPGSPSVTVAVLDTGVRFDHPDLSGKLYAGYDFIAADSNGSFKTANDSDGRDADASDPGDWTTLSDNCGGASASSWHGTETAGLVGAATDNGVGMASVGRDVMVLPVRVLGRCGGFDSDIIAGMRWAAGMAVSGVPANQHPARVLNMSLGSTGSCNQSYTDVFNELRAAGVAIVVAAGNDEGLAIGTPANCPGAITVAGLRHAGTKVGYSNVGPEVTLAAPAGNCVNTANGTPCLYPLLTTSNSGLTTPVAPTYTDSRGTLSTSAGPKDYSTLGTSFSAPLVAGTVALMLSVDPTLTPAAITSRLQASARPFPTTGSDPTIVACRAPNGVGQDECYCTTSTCGAGMLDAAAAVAASVPSAVPPPTAVAVASTTTPTAGDSVTLSASSSSAAGGRSVASYQWTITAGATLATLTPPTDASAVTLVTSGAGSVTVQLTVTDSAGASASALRTIQIQAAPASSSGSGGGGGGAISLLWAALLAAAVVALQGANRHAR